MSKRKARLCAAIVAVVGLGVTGVVSTEAAGGQPQGLAQARRATARFHDVAAAEAAGYLNPGPGHCVELPGVGGMGIHFVNPALLFDGGALDPARPEVLLYAPGKGGLRLVGVEYVVRNVDWHGGAPPDLFGKPFDGPMPEHEPNTIGEHYDQHAWIWVPNPLGTLTTWNPKVDCP